MREDCPKCINGWIRLADDQHEMCDCLLGQAMRRPQRFILHSKPQPDPIEQAFLKFKAQYEGKATE